MKTREELRAAVDNAGASASYRQYERVRAGVLDALGRVRPAGAPSDYWREELAGMEYMLDASPLIVRSLREHTHHLTGVHPYAYRGHHRHQSGAFARKLADLRARDPIGLFVPESPVLGGFGHRLEGGLVNLDTLKFYESLLAMEVGGVLGAFRAPGGPRRVVLEIGAGWGGFAYQFKTLFPDVTYVIADLPQTLLFSAVYLPSALPRCRVWLSGDDGAVVPAAPLAHDFVFVAAAEAGDLRLPRLDLVVNTVSFQEMTAAQVAAYSDLAHVLGGERLYSLNRDRSPHNPELPSVSAILGRRWRLDEVRVLDVPHTTLPAPARGRGPLRIARSLARWIGARAAATSPHRYRHLVGSRRPAPPDAR